jgi:predicted ATPase
MYRRGDEPDSLNTILAQKLYWTFQCDKIGNLVTKGVSSSLSFSMKSNEHTISYRFSNSTTRKIVDLENSIEPRASNSIFLPSREVFSQQNIILQTREVDRAFGFDETHYDLAQALTQRGHTNAFTGAREKLENLIGGRMVLDDYNRRWMFSSGNQRFCVGATAESVRRIGTLEVLLANNYLDTNSIIFIDQPEAGLHPSTLSTLLEIIASLSAQGIQFFLATSSEVALKTLRTLSHTHRIPVSIISNEANSWMQYNLLDGILDNIV